MDSVQTVTSTLKMPVVYNENRVIIELLSIADHYACTTAWSQRSWSFDLPVKTGDIIKIASCALARPIENWDV